MNERHYKTRLRQSVSTDELALVTKLMLSLERFLEDPPGPNGVTPTPRQLAGLAKRLLDLRRSRARFFDANIFGEPAWDMMLALYIASVEQYRLKITDLVCESWVPPSTALRWINRLQELGLLVRHENPLDGRVVFVQISDTGGQKVSSLLEHVWPQHYATGECIEIGR